MHEVLREIRGSTGFTRTKIIREMRDRSGADVPFRSCASGLCSCSEHCHSNCCGYLSAHRCSSHRFFDSTRRSTQSASPAPLRQEEHHTNSKFSLAIISHHHRHRMSLRAHLPPHHFPFISTRTRSRGRLSNFSSYTFSIVCVFVHVFIIIACLFTRGFVLILCV